MRWNTSGMPDLQLSRATAIIVNDCCQFDLCWMFGPKMELMAFDGLIGSTTEQSCLFSDLICYYQWYETLTNDVTKPQPCHSHFWLLIAANLALAGFFGWKWSLWPVLTWLAVQRSKALFFLSLYDSMNDMEHFRMNSSNLSRARVIFVVDCCQFGPCWMFGLKMELMVCANLVGGTTEQICIFPDIIW